MPALAAAIVSPRLAAAIPHYTFGVLITLLNDIEQCSVVVLADIFPILIHLLEISCMVETLEILVRCKVVIEELATVDAACILGGQGAAHFTTCRPGGISIVNSPALVAGLLVVGMIVQRC